MPQIGNRWSRFLHNAFEVGIIAKAIFALTETLSGLALLSIRADWVRTAAGWLTASELSEDPGDLFSRWIMAAAQGFNVSTQHFWGAYLIGHGLIKFAAVGALIAGFRWAYPLSIAVLIGFILWQMQKWVATHSALMIGLSVFDVVVIWLIWHEWRTLPEPD
ncbi:MAG: DUF2127 domain-containing protein [Paracoccaceae bacterium]